jgi:hypothetical protein
MASEKVAETVNLRGRETVMVPTAMRTARMHEVGYTLVS